MYRKIVIMSYKAESTYGINIHDNKNTKDGRGLNGVNVF